MEKEYQRLLEVSTEMLKDREKEPNDNIAEIASRFFTSQKYKSLYSKYPVVCHVILYNKILQKKALKIYYDKYNSASIQSKKDYDEVNEAYLTNLRLKGINSNGFIQFHMSIMDKITHIKDEEEVDKKKILEMRSQVNRELLRQRILDIKESK